MPGFDADGRLVSEVYGDIYFAADAVAETEHVFCGGNRLAQRFERVEGSFVVAETGFGTGSNFLVVADWFERCAPPAARLVFVSVDERLLDAPLLERVHARLGPRFEARASALRTRLAGRDGRGDRVAWRDGRIALYVLLGDAFDRISCHDWRADAWLLDGFAPARNPAMWTPELLAAVAERTAPGGTFATFTVAGAVRRGLEAAGFEVERRAGFGAKREMACGRLVRPRPVPWFDLPPAVLPSTVTVEGAGIAGAAAARAFAERGATVTVVDPFGVAAGASGLRAAVVEPRLWVGDDVPDAEVVATAFRWTAAWFVRRGWHAFSRCGVLHTAGDPHAADELRRRIENPATADLATWLDPDAAAAACGVSVPFGGGFLGAGGWVDLAALVGELLAHDRIEVRRDDPDRDADVRVLATARSTALGFLPTEPTRGQAIAVRWPDAVRPESVVSGTGYLTPSAVDGIGWMGSTYDRGDDSDDVREADDARVRAHFAALDSIHSAIGDAPVVDRFAAVRATTPDRLPYVGAVPRERAFRTAFGAAIRSRAERIAGDAAAGMARTFATLAHGSRGATTAPFAGELLAARAFGEPLPIAPAWRHRIEPARALVRAIRRAPR